MSKKKKNVVYEQSVLWICSWCGAFNLHPATETDGEFECVWCGVIYAILYDPKLKLPK